MEGSLIFEFCQKKNYFLNFFAKIWIKTFFFHWKAQLFVLFKLSFKFLAGKSLSVITEKMHVLIKVGINLVTVIILFVMPKKRKRTREEVDWQ